MIRKWKTFGDIIRRDNIHTHFPLLSSTSSELIRKITAVYSLLAISCVCIPIYAILFKKCAKISQSYVGNVRAIFKTFGAKERELYDNKIFGFLFAGCNFNLWPVTNCKRWKNLHILKKSVHYNDSKRFWSINSLVFFLFKKHMNNMRQVHSCIDWMNVSVYALSQNNFTLFRSPSPSVSLSNFLWLQ